MPVLEPYKFPCGCILPVTNGHYKIDFEHLNYDCPKTWDIYCEGQTQSIFQLEKYLGKMWSKKCKPRNIEDAAALISILRPGTLNSYDEKGNSMTEVYANRKIGKDTEIDKNDPLYSILSKTQMVNIYQESSMEICKSIAGFDGKAQMKLLKGIGKKKANVILALRKEFIDGCARVGVVNEEQSNKIFDNIEASSRYAFNKSHAISYSVIGFWTAWIKTHLPYHYVCAWLRNAKNEQKPLEEIRSVISESRRLGIDILPPSIKNVPATNFFIKDKSVYFGLDSIKGCGEKSIAKLIDLDIDLESTSWLEFLVLYSKLINKTNIINMIRTGCFDYMGRSRMECEFMYNQWAILTLTENKKAIDLYKRKLHMSLTKLLGDFLEIASKNRKPVIQSIIDTLENAPVDLNDSKDNIVAHEKQLMGINVSCSKIDKAEIPDGKDQCANVDKTKLPYYVLVGEITDLKEFKIKNGKMVGEIMANFKLTDDSGECDCVIFPNKLNYYQGAIYDGNVIMIKGKKSNRSGLIVEECFEV